MRKLIVAVLVLVGCSLPAYGAQRPIDFSWENPVENIQNQPLDTNGDGDLSEGLTGYNIYRVGCTDILHTETNEVCGTVNIVDDNERVEIMLADIEPWDNLSWTGRFNLSFNPVFTSRLPSEQHCFVATAYWRGDVEQADGTTVTETHESGNSNIVCKPWVRQTPKPPRNMRSS